ncbi:MAG TPA: DinB family protein [Candidatus Limnocylindria bacterium]|nr:DinB family protein [Candidatus Limnocylindria bacterium]
MDTNDREQMLKMLAESREALFAAAASISDEQARIRPAPDQWSVLDCVEHVAIAEHFMLTTIATKSAPAPPPEDRAREELFLCEIVNRAKKISAPERAHPTGRFPTLAAALEQFNQSRARTIEYVKHCDKDLRAHTAPHIVFGPITVQEFLIVIALHPARHAAQIREVRETLGLASR